MNESEFNLVSLPNGWTVGRFAALERLAGVRHLVTTRRGLSVDLIRAERAAAAKALAGAMGIRGVAFLEQIHGNEIIEVAGGSAWPAACGPAGRGDGLVTDVPGLGLMGVSADCPLILVADAQGPAVGMAHASWRGTVRLIASKLVGRLAERYGAEPSRLVACICPSAGPRRYEVGPDVVEAAVAGIGPGARAFFTTRAESGGTRSDGKMPSPRDGKTFFNLWAANRDQLLAAGLREENVHVAGICTIERNDLFPSHRVEGASAGRFAAVIAAGCQGV